LTSLVSPVASNGRIGLYKRHRWCTVGPRQKPIWSSLSEESIARKRELIPRSKMALFSLKDLFEQYLDATTDPLQPVGVVDIGAMSLGDETDAHHNLFKQGLCTVVGFEPVKAECDKLVANCGPHRKFFPYAVGNGQPATLHVCNEAMTSSLYEPNTELVNMYSHLGEVMQVVKKEEIATKRLDDILSELGEVDFVKLDVQGGELDVIQGGQAALSQALVVQTEVEFVPLYKNQPLFAEIDQALRGLGFEFHRFLGMSGRTMKPLVITGNPFQPVSQHLWSDAVYVRDMMKLDTVSAPKLLKMALVLHEVYQSYDIVHHVLQKFEQKVGGDRAKTIENRTLSMAYYERLTGVPRPVS